MSSQAVVPEGMSYVNAWYALYSGIPKTSQFFAANPDQLPAEEEKVSTSDKVANIFKNYPPNRQPPYYMEYEGGRKMKVHFCDFPQLDVYNYDADNGPGAAQRALDNYALVASENRFDLNDSYKFSDLRSNTSQ